MKFFELAKTFRDDESGAVTVDWVVLTAAIVGLGIAVIASVRGGVTELGDSIETSLEGGEVEALDLDGDG
ncbi:MAG: hypothetical protein HLUCCA12_04480 [Rhodobacteraceae bacterium HLUCCA12]|nr:MAG: hypothetical protein HLUCCA12_04480 [Rhodobacteraceae bacterium HLUCCA12]